MNRSSDSTKLGIRLITVAALGLTLLVPAQARAQVAGATLSGTVTDASGAIVPQARISIRNVATAISRDVSVNSDGFYTVPNLLPGTYEMSGSAPGFATEVRSGITLTVGAQQVLNFTLQVGQVNQRIEVSGEALDIQLASSAIGGMVNSNTVVELPLNGRDWTSLAVLQPGVHVIPTQQAIIKGNSTKGFRGLANQMSISGTRPNQSNYRVDGISVVDYANGAPASALGITLGVDAIQEFSVLTSNSSAEYGRTSGGVVNAITRSGTNQIHGTAFWFLRDEGLDARGFFDPPKIPSFHRNQFGGSAGGPIQKDKTFFFADYEGLRQSKELTAVNFVPSADARNGIIHNLDGTTTTVIVDPLVKPYLAFWPLPNAGLISPGNTGNFNIPINNVAAENFVTTRIDRKFSDKDSAFGTYFYDHGTNAAPDSLNDVLIGAVNTRQMIGLEETHVFSPSLVNSFRVGYSRANVLDAYTISAINPLAADPSLGSFLSRPASQVNVTGLTGFTGGLGATSIASIIWNSYQIYDDAFLTKGVHSLRFGFGFERTQTNSFVPANQNGFFSFSSLTNFLTNTPATFKGAPPSSISARRERQSIIAGYIQDDWRLRPNLTLNLGLRYEPVTVPTEVDNKITRLLTVSSAYPPTLGSPFYNNATLRNFEPRVGFSWDPFHNGKTAVRGAFGVFDALPLTSIIYVDMSKAAPYLLVITKSKLAPGDFPKQAAGSLTPATSDLGVFTIEANPHRSYVMIWNLNVQRQLTPSSAVTVGYVGNRGIHMVNLVDDANGVLPTQTPLGLLWPSPTGSGTKVNPTVGNIRAIWWGGDSYYDALTVTMSKRMSHGIQVQGSYSWSKGIDTGSASGNASFFTNSISSLPWYCETCRRGLADFDIAHTLVVNYLWDLPTPKSWGRIGSHVLGGWELGGIITAETGVPFTPLIGGDPLGLKNGDQFAYPNRLKGGACDSAVNPRDVKNYINLTCFALPSAPSSFAGCAPGSFPGAATPPPSGQVYCSNLIANVGRNSIIGPGILNYDFSVFKNNRISKISETFNAQFRAEFFNMLNHANFAAPVDTQTLFGQTGTPIAGAGRLTSLSTSPRDIQLALKLIW